MISQENKRYLAAFACLCIVFYMIANKKQINSEVLEYLIFNDLNVFAEFEKKVGSICLDRDNRSYLFDYVMPLFCDVAASKKDADFIYKLSNAYLLRLIDPVERTRQKAIFEKESVIAKQAAKLFNLADYR